MPFYLRSASATLLYKVKNPPVNDILAFGQDMNEKRSGDFRLSPPANLANSAILPPAKISASLIEILSSRSHKTPAVYAPLIPTGEE